MKKLIFSMVSMLIFFGGVAVSDGIAQGTPPDIKVALTLDKTIYAPGEPILMILTLANEGDVDIITSKGFSDTEFYLLLRFFDEKGNVITSDRQNETNAITPSPPKVFPDDTGLLLQGELVETLKGKASGTDVWVASFGSFTDPNNYLDAYDYYPMAGRSGHFTVKAVIPMTNYLDYQLSSSRIPYALLDSADWQGAVESKTVAFTLVVDADGDGYYYPEPYGVHPEADCDDTDPAVHPGVSEIPNNGKDDDCNPETPDTAVVNPGFINIQADKHTVGYGSHPGSTKEPIAGMPVRVYDKTSGSCASDIGVSWKHYKTIWLSCNQPNGAGNTDELGKVNIEMTPGDYLVIGKYADEIYLGVSAGGLDSGETLEKYLQVIEKADKKKVPAKYTRKTGSDLLVIEPEYVEWDGTQELYPFVFESAGDWSVTTALSPPEGFTADQTSLSEKVNTEAKAVQFTVTDVGSRWASTGVLHTVKHRKKTQKIQSKIGVKLTQRLAAEKGVSIWGEDDQGQNDDDQGQNDDDQGQDQGKGKGKKK